MRNKEDSKGGKGKITAVVLNIEGSDSTLQEALRTLNNAMSSMVVHPRTLLVQSNAQMASGEIPGKDASEQQSEVSGDEVSIDRDDAVNDAEGSGRAPRPPKSRTVIDLNLTAAERPLKTFLEEKSVNENDSQRYLTIAYWYQQYMAIEAVTMDHIHTAYRFMSWNTPKDAGAALRNLKRQGLFHKGEEKGAYKINHVGENAVRNLA